MAHKGVSGSTYVRDVWLIICRKILSSLRMLSNVWIGNSNAVSMREGSRAEAGIPQDIKPPGRKAWYCWDSCAIADAL